MSSGSTSTANVDDPGQCVFVCKPESSTFEIAELFVVEGAMGDPEFDAARQYLLTKYGL